MTYTTGTMIQLPIEQTLHLGLQHHQAGRLAQAEALYQQVLARDPHNADALHFLGVIAKQVGRHDAAIELIGRAIALAPHVAAFHSNLGEAYRARGELEQTAACCRRALELQPNFPDACNNLGLCLHQLGRRDEAQAAFRRAIALQPDHPLAHSNLADTLSDQGKLDEAVAEYRVALRINPASSTAYNNLGAALTRLGRVEEAIAAFRKAIECTPQDPVPHQNLAEGLYNTSRADEAADEYQAAIRLDPRLAAAHCGLGNVLKNGGRPDDAIVEYRRALELKPDDAVALANLGSTLRDRGEIAEGLACLRKARALDPASAAIQSALIMSLFLVPGIDSAEIENEKRLWDETHARPLRPAILPHENSPDPGRRLRIGYVSPDLREHPVGRFLLTLLPHHDRTQCEIYCYSSTLSDDPITRSLQHLADHWRPVAALDDARLAALIREDRIDILVDLAMHAIKNRLLTFARKPAPVQITYLAYPDGTGLSTIDYRLTDPYLDPPDRGDDRPFERPLRLPETYWCYTPATETPAVNALPALAAGHITFGALNDFCKVSPLALETWVRILQRLPTARLIMHAPAGSPQQRARQFFLDRGIDAARITLTRRMPIEQYFAAYHHIDIALAPFPYPGGTTLCDALWMGVPPITLAGPTSYSRGGLSILSNVGLPQFIATSADEYVDIAANLAADLPALATLRQELRPRLQRSPLGDTTRFARHIETAYRTAWNQWCAERTAGGNA